MSADLRAPKVATNHPGSPNPPSPTHLPDARMLLDSRIPLIVGVTGHRDLRAAARPRLADAVAALFARLRERCPHTPIVLLSPLAEGADRLVAEVALRTAEARLVVPLPMPRAEYERDFPTAASRAEFADLLAAAANVLELPLPPGLSADGLHHDRVAREQQYRAVGEFVARHSAVLIALWDGKPGESYGTAGVVQLKLTGDWPHELRDDSRSLTGDEIVTPGPVLHVLTPRERDTTEVAAVATTELSPTSESDAPVLARLESYNSAALRLARENPEAAARAADGLVAEGASLGPVGAALEPIRRQYAAADALANHYQARVVSALFWVSIMVFLAALAFDSAMHLLVGDSTAVMAAKAALLFASPVLMLLAILIYLRAKRHDWQNKYQDCRGLAEALRVQFFWRLAGLDESVADHYLGRHRWELEWIRAGCRAALVAAGMPLAPVAAATPATALACWVEPQHDYLVRAITRQERRIKRFESWVKACFWVGLTAIFVLALMLTARALREGQLLMLASAEQSPIHGGLLMLITMPAVIAALVHNYMEKLALAPQVRMYDGMRRLYRRCAEQLRSLRSGDWRPALARLGQAALLENGDWIMTHRERPLEVPHH